MKYLANTIDELGRLVSGVYLSKEGLITFIGNKEVKNYFGDAMIELERSRDVFFYLNGKKLKYSELSSLLLNEEINWLAQAIKEADELDAKEFSGIDDLDEWLQEEDERQKADAKARKDSMYKARKRRKNISSRQLKREMMENLNHSYWSFIVCVPPRHRAMVKRLRSKAQILTNKFSNPTPTLEVVSDVDDEFPIDNIPF